MNQAERMIETRRLRCQAMGLDLIAHEKLVNHPNRLASVVSSRLGHDAVRHRKMARHLAESMQSFRESESTVLIVEGTAIESWAIDAADVFDVPTLIVSRSPDRDRLMTAIPERVDAVYLRSKGKLGGLVQERLACESGTTRVAMEGRAAQAMLRHGAVGSYLPIETTEAKSDSTMAPISIEDLDWNDYLVHCTRSVSGRWPGQTVKQYRHDMLLGDSTIASRTATASLRRIVQQRRLIAGAIASNHQLPVVCFTSVPLPEILERRTYRSHLHRWDYEPFGIAIRKSAAEWIGVQPVAYGDDEESVQLPPADRYRFQAKGKRNDWTQEKEWRAQGDIDLDALDPRDVIVFTKNDPLADSIASINHKQWQIVIVER